MSAKKQKPIVFAILIVVGVGALLYHFTREKTAEPSEVYTIHCVSLATHKDVEVKAHFTERAPYECPETHEMCVYPWFFDKKTGKRFVPNLVVRPGEPPRLPMVPTNPANGNPGRTWIPELYEEDYTGDEELPEWPIKQ